MNWRTLRVSAWTQKPGDTAAVATFLFPRFPSSAKNPTKKRGECVLAMYVLVPLWKSGLASD